MSTRPQDTSAEGPDGGNPHIRFRGGAGRGNQPGLLNKKIHWLLATSLILLSVAASAQFSPAPASGPPTKTTYVRLSNNANAILIEPVTPDPVKSHIVVIVTHPGINNFDYFVTRGLPPYGYRVLAINHYGSERSFYDLLSPIAQGIKALRAMPGVDKVVLFGHSTGGAEVTAYEDVAENGPAACQRPERIVKCSTAQASNLPKADALLLMDGNSGAPESVNGTNPAIDPHDSHKYNPALDLFNPENGYDPKTGSANYSQAFLNKFFAAQAARANQLIAEAQARLVKIQNGQGEFREDEPFVVAGHGLFANEEKPELAYIGLLSQTHAPHMLLKADGTRPVQIITEVKYPEKEMRPANTAHEYAGPTMSTVRSYLSDAIRLMPDYHWTKDNIYGVDWHSTAVSAPGSIEGIHVPTLVMSASCAVHMVYLEQAYDHSPAKDKEYVSVEGANHGFNPCRPEYGDTFKRAFDYVNSWLSKPGRLL